MASPGPGKQHDVVQPPVGEATPEGAGNRGGPATTSATAPTIKHSRQRRASSGEKQNSQYYKLDNRLWYLDWVSEDQSAPTKPPCGGVLYIQDCNVMRLVGAVSGWEDWSVAIRIFFVETVYAKNGKPDHNAKGCRLAWKNFRGFGNVVATLPFYRPITSDREPAVLLREFFDDWQRTVSPDRCKDVAEGHPISMPIARVSDDVHSKTQTSETAVTNGDEEVAVAKTPAKNLDPNFTPPQLEHSQAYEELEPEIEVELGTITKTTAEKTAAAVRQRSENPSKGMTITIRERGEAESEGHVRRDFVQASPRTGRVDKGKKLAPAQRNVGEEGSDEEGGDNEDTPVLSAGEKRVGQGTSEGQKQKKRKVTSGEGSSVRKRKQAGEKGETAKKKRGSGAGMGPSRGRKDKDEVEVDQEEGVDNRVIDSDAGYFMEWKDGVKRNVSLLVNPERVIPLPAWELPYNHRFIDDTHVNFILKAMMKAYSKPEHTYEKPVVK
ncbi:hypothetical protein CBR_g4165 [Chara braunii]|uniref:Uncharacterized protein n=1 Tax=Chara braunii TaxID=69332 RepID=A0A388KHD3_CHABU|nr:hypothetical protein CBR_g4165 [Chara braunii]|eukprot:GBG69470.1 hypothetical protein CBR_g4165 [Chara braunii]